MQLLVVLQFNFTEELLLTLVALELKILLTTRMLRLHVGPQVGPRKAGQFANITLVRLLVQVVLHVLKGGDPGSSLGIAAEDVGP